MDRSALSRKRRQDAVQPAHVFRDKKILQEKPRRPASGKIRTAKDSSEIIRVPRRTEPLDRQSGDDDSTARHFTVANVGAGGMLYLKPSRMPPHSFTQPPVTPPDTSDGNGPRTEWPGARESNASTATWTPRLQQARVGLFDHAIPVPPLSMSNTQQKRRSRSHSFSTVGEPVRSPTFDSNDFQILLNGKDTGGRPKSSVDLSGGFLDLHIPHYRLGTPQFSERGTAYLHNSMATMTTATAHSSVLSRADYDKLFPVPPGHAHSPVPISRIATSPYLHPSSARSITPTRTPPTPPVRSESPGGITPLIFDRIEANPNDPAIVRYNTQGRIKAATPARLIAQITSPVFLDYELLSDFFLTFRNFLPCRDLLEYLMARMKWALGTSTDSGRIVRVRTFVALRHWILNYFSDDFALDINFRQRFCDLVNDLARSLQQRPDRGGGDLNIVGELKKCWRRTCAMFWPVEDALDTAADADIVPGGEQSSMGFAASAASLPLQHLHSQTSKADFRRVSAPLQIPAEREHVESADRESAMQAFGPASGVHTRQASIPASPMSEQSLHVLSCSVPFLRHIRSAANAKDGPRSARPPGPQKNPPLSGKQRKNNHQHKRSGSFSDALRDGRAPLPSTKVDSIDIRSLAANTFTGGLVRGLLLQPSPAKVNLLIPISPGLGNRVVHFGVIEDSYFHDRNGQNQGVKRFVGDVRRALSSRKGRPDSPTRSRGSHQSTNSAESRQSAHLTEKPKDKPNDPSAWQQLRGPPRVDMLGDKIGHSYDVAFQEANLPNPADDEAQQQHLEQQQKSELQDEVLALPRPDLDRWNSRVTTGSRSIVIMDDTGLLEKPLRSGALPSVSSWSSGMAPQPLFGNPDKVFMDIAKQDYHAGKVALRSSASYPPEKLEALRRSSDVPMHDLLSVSDAWKQHQSGLESDQQLVVANGQARKSSSIHPPGLQMPSASHQLRRRPGGDLKAADHVHELQPLPRPDTYGSFSTVSHSGANSNAHSGDLSGTHFSGQDFASWRLPSNKPSDIKNDSVSLLDSREPNMRPSFEAEVSRLAALPDQSNHGGIEDTLRQLEGHVRNSTNSMLTGTEDGMPPLARQPHTHGPLRVTNASISANDSTSTDEPNVLSPTKTETQGASIYHLSGSDMTDDYAVQSYRSSDRFGRSETQGSAAPVLPGVANTNPLLRYGSGQDDTSLKSVVFAVSRDGAQAPEPSDMATKSDSAPKSGTPQGSFLLDDNESLSDISTEIADQSGDDSLGVRSFFFDDTVDDDDVLPQSFRAPPTPPSTVGAPPGSPERSSNRPELSLDSGRLLKEAQSAPKLLSPNFDRQRMQQQHSAPLQLPPPELRRVNTAPSPQAASHLPFVLAFESEVVAEQLTIIEKDALDEVDWKDLIGLNWRQAPPNVRNWVEYLKKDDSTGIDIVVARFNLVVKWVVSEIMLTDAPGERARCITKFIHIATHCHRFRNYASMYQITLALLSADLARLHRTWALVAPAEKQKLDRLEKLCQPLRNFHNLRAEMEASTVDSGCIPFIGLYTHDLMFNSQKPSRIETSPPTKEPLINFERFQAAATIVKSLLRLIEASSKYIFHPHPEVLSRCLWLAALEDAEITTRSKALEH